MKSSTCSLHVKHQVSFSFYGLSSNTSELSESSFFFFHRPTSVQLEHASIIIIQTCPAHADFPIFHSQCAKWRQVSVIAWLCQIKAFQINSSCSLFVQPHGTRVINLGIVHCLDCDLMHPSKACSYCLSSFCEEEQSIIN